MSRWRLALSLLNAMKRLTGFGVGIPPQLVRREGSWIQEQEFDLLGPRCFTNWSHDPIVERDGFTYAPMVWGASHNPARIAQRMTTNEGETWLLWNEPERPEQANIDPALAANLTREFLRTAWDTDREFQWAAPGVCIGSDSYDGLEWATIYAKNLRRRGISRPTYWHIHAYRSPSRQRFFDSMARWQEWYQVWGAGAPVIMSEVCAESAPYVAQIEVMEGVAVLLRNGTLTAAFWFSSHVSNDSQWHNAALCSVDTANQQVKLTPLGEHFVGLGL